MINNRFTLILTHQIRSTLIGLFFLQVITWAIIFILFSWPFPYSTVLVVWISICAVWPLAYICSQIYPSLFPAVVCIAGQSISQWALGQLPPTAMDPDNGGRVEGRISSPALSRVISLCSCLSAVALTPIWWPFPYKREVINRSFILIRWLQLWGLATLFHIVSFSPGSLALLLLGWGLAAGLPSFSLTM